MYYLQTLRTNIVFGTLKRFPTDLVNVFVLVLNILFGVVDGGLKSLLGECCWKGEDRPIWREVDDILG